MIPYLVSELVFVSVYAYIPNEFGAFRGFWEFRVWTPLHLGKGILIFVGSKPSTFISQRQRLYLNTDTSCSPARTYSSYELKLPLLSVRYRPAVCGDSGHPEAMTIKASPWPFRSKPTDSFWLWQQNPFDPTSCVESQQSCDPEAGRLPRSLALMHLAVQGHRANCLGPPKPGPGK